MRVLRCSDHCGCCGRSYCVKRHPVVHSALVSLRIRRIVDPEQRADKAVAPCTAEMVRATPQTLWL